MVTLERVLMDEGTKKFAEPQKDLLRRIAGKRASVEKTAAGSRAQVLSD
jgi:hypothetical protein